MTLHARTRVWSVGQKMNSPRVFVRRTQQKEKHLLEFRLNIETMQTANNSSSLEDNILPKKNVANPPFSFSPKEK